jgi:hypothetical protein
MSYLRRYFSLQNVAYDGPRRQIHHYFYDVNTIDVNRVDKFNAQIVEDTQSFHQIKSVGIYKKKLCSQLVMLL